MYTVKNYKTKKELIEDFKNGVVIEVFEPGIQTDTFEGRVALEGPHYPKPHKWYAEAIIKDRKIIYVK